MESQKKHGIINRLLSSSIWSGKEDNKAEKEIIFYKPDMCNLHKEYKKYSEMISKGKVDKITLFKIGRINHYRGNLEEAIIYYDKALLIDHDYGEVHYNLGNIFFNKKEFHKAKDHLEKAINLNPSDVYAINALGRTYFSLLEFSEALTCHRKALEINQKDVYALRGIGNIGLVQKNFAEAFNYYSKALDVNSQDSNTLYNNGIAYILSGNIEKAREHYKTCLNKYDFPGFYLGLNLCYYKQGKTESAPKHYTYGLKEEFDTDFSFVHKLEDKEWNLLLSEIAFCKGNICYVNGNINKAIEEFTLAIEFNPSFIEAFTCLGKLHGERGDYPSAIRYYEEVLKLEEDNINIEMEICKFRLFLNPSDRKTLKRLHKIYWWNEDVKKEIDVLEKLVKLSPDKEDLYNLGYACLLDGQKEKGEELFNYIINSGEKEDLGFTGMALLYKVKKDYPSAINSFLRAIKINKKSEYYIHGGNIYAEAGDNEKALECYFQSFKCDPWSNVVHNSYLDCLLVNNDKERALNIIKEHSSLEGYKLLLSAFYNKTGEYEKAEKSLMEYNLPEERAGIFHLYLGISYQGQGYFEKALEELKKSVIVEEYKGNSYALMALIYGEPGNKSRVIEMIDKTKNYTRYLGFILRYRLCVLMDEMELKEYLLEFLDKLTVSINFNPYFCPLSEKEKSLEELNKIREGIHKIKDGDRLTKEDLSGTGKDKLSVEKSEKYDKKEKNLSEENEEEIKKKPENFVQLMSVDPISLEVGRSLLALVDPNQGAKLLDRITSIRRHIALEMGIIVSGVRFRDNLQLKPNGYVVKIRDIEVAAGEVIINRFLAIGTENHLTCLKGPRCFDPTYGMPAVWITADQRSEAESAGCMIFDTVSVMATQITEVIRTHGGELLGRQEVADLLETVKKSHPALVNEVYPDLFTLGEIQKVLQNLVKEKISIRDFVTVMETLGDYAHITKDTDMLTEYVRQSICRVICREYQNNEGTITVITLDQELENIIAGAVQRTEYGSFLTLDPNTGQVILYALGEQIQSVMDKGMQPIVLCSPQVRLYLRRLTERPFPNLVVLSYNEIAPRVNVNSIGLVTLPSSSEERKTERRDIFSYIEKLQTDPHPSIRCEAMKILSFLGDKNDLDKIYSYIDMGLSDENEDVRIEAAKVLKDLCSKNLY